MALSQQQMKKKDNVPALRTIRPQIPQILAQSRQFELKESCTTSPVPTYNSNNLIDSATKRNKINPSQNDQREVTVTPYYEMVKDVELYSLRGKSKESKVRTMVLGSETDEREGSNMCIDDRISFTTQDDERRALNVKSNYSQYDREGYESKLMRHQIVNEFYDDSLLKMPQKRNGPLPEIKRNSAIVDNSNMSKIASPSRTQANKSTFSPREFDFQQQQQYLESAAKTSQKRTAVLKKPKLRPPLPKINWQENSKLNQVQERKETEVPPWVNKQIKKHSNYITRIYQGTQNNKYESKEMYQQQSPYQEVRHANKLLQRANKKLTAIPKLRQPHNLVKSERLNQLEMKIEQTSPTKRRKQSNPVYTRKLSKTYLQMERSESKGRIKNSMEEQQMLTEEKARKKKQHQLSKLNLNTGKQDSQLTFKTISKNSASKAEQKLRMQNQLSDKMLPSTGENFGKMIRNDSSVTFIDQSMGATIDTKTMQKATSNQELQTPSNMLARFEQKVFIGRTELRPTGEKFIRNSNQSSNLSSMQNLKLWQDVVPLHQTTAKNNKQSVASMKDYEENLDPQESTKRSPKRLHKSPSKLKDSTKSFKNHSPQTDKGLGLPKLRFGIGSRKRSIPPNKAVQSKKGKGYSRTRLTFDHPDKHFRNTSEHAANKKQNVLSKIPSVVKLNKKRAEADNDSNVELFAAIDKPISVTESEDESKFERLAFDAHQPQIKVLDETERKEFLNMQTKLVEIIDKDRDRILQLEKKLEELQIFKDHANEASRHTLIANEELQQQLHEQYLKILDLQKQTKEVQDENVAQTEEKQDLKPPKEIMMDQQSGQSSYAQQANGPSDEKEELEEEKHAEMSINKGDEGEITPTAQSKVHQAETADYSNLKKEATNVETDALKPPCSQDQRDIATIQVSDFRSVQNFEEGEPQTTRNMIAVEAYELGGASSTHHGPSRTATSCDIQTAQKEPVVQKKEVDPPSMEFIEEPVGLDKLYERQASPPKVSHPLQAEPIPVPVESIERPISLKDQAQERFIEIEKAVEEVVVVDHQLDLAQTVSDEIVREENQNQKTELSEKIQEEPSFFKSLEKEANNENEQNLTTDVQEPQKIELIDESKELQNDQAIKEDQIDEENKEVLKNEEVKEEQQNEEHKSEDMDSGDDLERYQSSGSLIRDPTADNLLKSEDQLKQDQESFSLKTFQMKERLKLMQEINRNKAVDMKHRSLSTRKPQNVPTLAVIPELVQDGSTPSNQLMATVQAKQKTQLTYQTSAKVLRRTMSLKQTNQILREQFKKESRRHGFTENGLLVVQQNLAIPTIVRIANARLYNLRNSVQVFHVHTDDLVQVRQDPTQSPRHSTLIDFDTGDDMVEVISLSDFYGKVLKDLGLEHMTAEADQISQFETFLGQIDALAENRSSQQNENSAGAARVIRFDIFRAAWQVHGYEFSNLKKLKKINGINFNMLSVKSIRIMNRFAKKVAQFQDVYIRKMKQQNLQKIKEKNLDMLMIVMLALFDEIIENLKVGNQTVPIIPAQLFYKKLMNLKVRKSETEVPNLSSFLAHKNQSSYIDAKRLATATGEFLRSQYLQSFGTAKVKQAQPQQFMEEMENEKRQKLLQQRSQTQKLN